MASYTIETLTGWVSTAESKVSTVGGRLEADRNQILYNRERILSLEQELDRLRASAGALQSHIASLESAAKNTAEEEDSSSGLQDQIGQARAELSRIQGQIASAEAEITRIQEANRQLWENIHVHTEKLREMDGTLGDISAELEKKYQEHASAKGKFDVIQGIRFGASAGAAASKMQSAMNQCRSAQNQARQTRERIRELLEDESLYDWNEDERDPTVSAEERKLITELEDSGEMDGDFVSLNRSHSRLSGNLLSEEPIVIDMPYHMEAGYGEGSFISQALDQEAGLNRLTVAEFLENYESRKKYGRSPEGTQFQKQYTLGLRETIKDDARNRNSGLTEQQLDALADYQLSGGAALHEPDQIAGGSPFGIHSYGDGKVNSALGSLWRHERAENLYQQVRELSKGMSPEEMKSTYLNVRLNIHPAD